MVLRARPLLKSSGAAAIVGRMFPQPQRDTVRSPLSVREVPARDREVGELIARETERQRETLDLIPSDNYASPAVRAALGSAYMNTYSEGYPGKRYYGGQEFVDPLERLAQARALEVFLKEEDRPHWHANVQPYSGSPANAAVLFALAPLGSPILGLALPHGGHLTHGHRVSFSGIAYAAHQYELHQGTHRLDYDAIRELAERVRPRIIISGATAYPRAIDFSAFQAIADAVGAVHLADISHVAGLIIGGVHPSPFPFTQVVTTTTHKTLRGPRGAVIFCQKAYAEAIDRAVFPGLQGGPHNHLTAAKAICFGEALRPEFAAYARQVVANARVLAERLLERGFSLVTGGTDTHLLLLNLTESGVTGREAQEVLERIGITANKNTIPGEPRSPFDPSGLRLGTPVVTTRGMKEPEMVQIADWMHEAITSRGDADRLARLRTEVRSLALAFPPR